MYSHYLSIYQLFIIIIKKFIKSTPPTDSSHLPELPCSRSQSPIRSSERCLTSILIPPPPLRRPWRSWQQIPKPHRSQFFKPVGLKKIHFSKQFRGGALKAVDFFFDDLGVGGGRLSQNEPKFHRWDHRQLFFESKLWTPSWMTTWTSLKYVLRYLWTRR